jgi:hypothetical protein
VFISGELQHAAGHLSSLAGPRPHASGDGCGQEGATSVSIARCITCRACCEMLGMCSATCGTGAGHGGPEPYQRRSWGECLIYPPPIPSLTMLSMGHPPVSYTCPARLSHRRSIHHLGSTRSQSIARFLGFSQIQPVT